MVTKTLIHTSEGAAAPAEDFPFAMVTPDRTVLADTRTELLDALIPGYLDLAEGENGVEETAWRRHQFAVALSGQIGQVVLGSQVDVDASSLSEDDLNALLRQDPTSVPFSGEWSHDFPLTLVRSEYDPHTPLDLPTGEVRFIDPTNDTRLLESLAALDLVEVYVRED